jgi:two-component system chemotaxis response regulator CheB
LCNIVPQGKNLLATVLRRCSQIPVQDAVSGECFQPGRIFLAPANHHLLVKPDGSFTLSDAARVRAVRPAADVLFASVATVFTTRVIAVVLTGWDSDGTNGIQIVKHWGGRVIAQDAASSEVFQMPRSAIATGDVDAVLSLEQIAPALVAEVATRMGLNLS